MAAGIKIDEIGQNFDILVKILSNFEKIFTNFDNF